MADTPSETLCLKRLTAALLLGGGFFVALSLVIPRAVPRDSQWANEQSAEVQRLTDELTQRRTEFYVILKRQGKPHTTEEPLALRLLEEKIIALKDERRASLKRPKQISRYCRTAGLSALALGVAVYFWSRTQSSKTQDAGVA